MPIPIINNDDGEKIIDFQSVFAMLNTELLNAGISLELVCAGGFIMQLHGYRGTVDVDAFYKSDAAIDDIIRKVGEKFGINKPDELWLNNSITNINSFPPDSSCVILYHFSNLIVKMVNLLYFIGMKLKSGREQDLKDVADILRAEKNEQPLDLMTNLNNIGFYPDISDVLDSFGTAHGIDWLEKFYETNQTELKKYF